MRPQFVAYCLALALLPTPAFADPLQQQVLAAAKLVSGDDFAFTQTTTAQRSGETGKAFVMRFDPRRPAGARWVLVSADGRAPTAKEAASAAKQSNSGPVPSYSRIARWFGAPATRIATGKDSVTYRFPALPKGTAEIGGHDASHDTVAEATVNTAGTTPFVERVRFTSATPFRMALVVKIERFVFTTTHRLTADGRPVMMEADGDMFGSLLGKAGSFKTKTVYSDVRPAR